MLQIKLNDFRVKIHAERTSPKVGKYIPEQTREGDVVQDEEA